MTVLELLILLHLLLLTYWLGADLGVFYSSRYVLKTELGTQARMTSLKIMVWLDMAPRICLVLFLPSGVSLMAASEYGEQFRWWPLVAIWVFSLGWLGLVLADHHYTGTPTGARIKNLDLLVRFGVMAGVIGAGLFTMLVDEPFGVTTNPKWLGAKVALYGVAILCGVLIRFRLKPFGPALGPARDDRLDAGGRARPAALDQGLGAVRAGHLGAGLRDRRPRRDQARRRGLTCPLGSSADQDARTRMEVPIGR